MSKTSWREISLVALDDPSIQWRTRSLVPRSSVPRRNASAGSQSVEQFNSRSVDIGGSFRIEGQDATDERIILWWSLAERSDTVDVLEIKLGAHLEGNAVVYQLPEGMHVMENGVKWFNKRGVESDTLVLAVATTCGEGFTAYFGQHPNASSNLNRTWNETHSFLWEKNKAAIEKVYSSPGHEERRLVQACCWFQNAKGVIALATVASKGESDASSEITFQSIPDTSIGEEAFSGRRLITRQASRSSFSFGNSTLGEEDQTNKVVYLGAFCRSILNQGLENSVSMPEDDTLIAAVYDDGSLHFASINYEQSPTNKINLLSLYDKVSQQEAVTSDGVVEEAWIEAVAVAENNRDISLELAIGLHLSSSRPILYTTKCSLGTSSISFEEETKILDCSNAVFRGYKLVDMKVHEEKLHSVWWKPVNSPSTLAIAHDIHGGDWSIKNFATIPMDAERTKLLGEDRVAESEKDLDTAFEARLALPGRFSTCELSDGLVSCFGRQQAANALRNVPEVHRKDVLNAAKRLVAQRTTQLQQSGGSQDQQAYRQVACTTWRRFVQACEVCWLHGHQVLAAGIADVGPGAGAGLIVVRRNRITCFQPTKPLEDGLYLASRTSNDVTDGILATVQNCTEWTRPMLAFNSDSLGSFGNGKNELLRKVRSSLLEIDNYDDIEGALAGLLSVVNGPKDFLSQLEMALDDLWATTSSPGIDKEELTTKGIPPRSILAQMTADRVLQILEARLTLGLTVLVVLEALSMGIPSYENFFSVFASRQRQELSNKIAKRCCTVAIVLYLGNFAPLEVERSLDWIRRFTMPPSDRSTPSARTTATGSILASSVFAHLVTSVLAPGSTPEVETLADRVCQLEDIVLPFLDAEQQYHVLATVAKASGRCLGDPDPARKESWYKGYENMYCFPKDRHIYFSMLQAKNSIWKSATEPEGDLTNYDRQALLFLQASTPHVSQDSTVLLEFMMHTMHLFGLAKKPSLALEFAFQAIKLPSCTRDQKRKLAKYIFAYALDMKDYKVAFAASRLCPRNEQGSSLKMFEGDRYLGQLVAIMMDHGAVKELCELPFQTCGEYVWREAIIKTIMRKTEASPPLLTAESGEDTPTLYHIAYSFCVSHVRFIEAVKCMYIMAHRLIKEVHDKFNDSWDVNMLYKLQSALQTAHSTFLLVPESKRTFFLNFKPHFFWETDTWTSGTDTDMKAGKIYRVTWDDVRKMFSLVRWAHSLMSKLGEHMRIPSNGMEPKALLANLSCCGHIDEAALLVTMFDQDATEMFRYLTESCIDEPFSGPRWRKIQSLLKMLDKVEAVDAETGEKKFLYVYTYHTVVTETLLSLRPMLAIPHWLMSSFLSWGEFASSPQSHIHAFAKQTSSKKEKARNPALLIRILVKYNIPESSGKDNAQKNRQLEEACTLATDLIVYTGDFPIDSEPPILPLRTLDLLMTRCEMAQVSNLKELQSAVRDYAKQLALTPYDTDSSLALNLWR